MYHFIYYCRMSLFFIFCALFCTCYFCICLYVWSGLLWQTICNVFCFFGRIFCILNLLFVSIFVAVCISFIFYFFLFLFVFHFVFFCVYNTLVMWSCPDYTFFNSFLPDEDLRKIETSRNFKFKV